MSEEESLDDQAGQLVKAVFEFMEGIRPKGGVFGPGLAGTLPPYEYRLGPTHGPAFTVRATLPRWEPPLPAFGALEVQAMACSFSKARPQEIPEAFRRR